MKSVQELRLAADQRKSVFFADMSEVQAQLRPDYLLDEAIHSVDPDLSNLKTMENRAKNNPIAVLAAISGLYLLVRQLTSKSQDHQPQPAKREKRSRLPRSTSKGDHHGNYDSTKPF
jgi:hypothetical protein